MIRVVKLFCESLGEKEFSPEHAQNILNYQQENHIPASKGWVIKDKKWEHIGGKLVLKHGNKPGTGVSDETPESKRDSTGCDPQP